MDLQIERSPQLSTSNFKNGKKVGALHTVSCFSLNNRNIIVIVDTFVSVSSPPFILAFVKLQLAPLPLFNACAQLFPITKPNRVHCVASQSVRIERWEPSTTTLHKAKQTLRHLHSSTSGQHSCSNMSQKTLGSTAVHQQKLTFSLSKSLPLRHRTRLGQLQKTQNSSSFQKSESKLFTHNLN
jgi:hypothetical protein